MREACRAARAASLRPPGCAVQRQALAGAGSARGGRIRGVRPSWCACLVVSQVAGAPGGGPGDLAGRKTGSVLDEGRLPLVKAAARTHAMSGRGSAARSRRQETDSGQRCLRHSSHVANLAGGSSMGSLPSSSPGVGMSMLAAHSASSSSDIGQVVCGASAWR